MNNESPAEINLGTPSTDQAGPVPVAGGPQTSDTHKPALETLQDEATRGLGKERRQIALLVLMVAVFMVLAHFTPLRAWLDNAQEWKRQLRDLGWLGHLGFFGLTAASVMLGVPRLSLAGAAGLLFGFAEGFILSLLATTLGSYGTFLAVRRGFRKAVSHHAEGLPWLKSLLLRPSLLKVFWVRQLALPGVVLNAVFGLADIRHRIFLAGTLLGYIPLNLAATLVGSGLGKESLAHTAVQLMAALAVINGVMWIVWRKLGRRQSPPNQGS